MFAFFRNYGKVYWENVTYVNKFIICLNKRKRYAALYFVRFLLLGMFLKFTAFKYIIFGQFNIKCLPMFSGEETCDILPFINEANSVLSFLSSSIPAQYEK